MRRNRLRRPAAILAAAALAAFGVVATAPPASATYGDPTQTSYSRPVLVIKYIPTADGVNIDQSVTGDVGGTVAAMRTKTDAQTANLKNKLGAGSAWHRYSNASAPQASNYSTAITYEYDYAVPTVPNPHYNGTSDVYKVRPDYNSVMNGVGICDWVQNHGVTDVWMYAYQGPTQLGISESEMSGPNGDISNSYRDNKMPVCNKTYTVYTFNEGRGSAEAIESYGHQIENELDYVDHNTFRNLFENIATPYPGNGSAASHCGSIHNPPNAKSEYDRADTAPHQSDCMAWYPDGTGTLSNISCANWGCNWVDDTNNPAENYDIWWMQNLPGRGNTVLLAGHHMRNWWDVHDNWDSVVASSRTLTVNFPCTGYGCDNLDPTASFDANSGAYCSANATTPVQIGADNGTLQMRWGPNCSVNWARFIPNGNGTTYYIWVGRQSPGYNTPGYEFTGVADQAAYSNQVYAPGKAQVCVLQWLGSTWGNQVCTAWT